ncbi:penicillin-binding protein 1A [Formosa sp. PL04]|uniref:penicillin-binding protein 1A n=1 Tax=Formosa sp. PL04 TaxID=3081755 RepID=UPI002982B624|nr:transglycosylase domain-containing protein [Formosa sp. PL04]MDW5289056.1 transglycosylase domain-containing protein [Formosa sp. PL04]
MAKKKQPVKKQSYGTYIRWFWVLFLTGVIAVVLLFLSASVFGDLPDHTVLENPKTNLATEIISSDGKTLGKFYFNDNRTPVAYEALPQHLVDALIATEDARFFEHSGIDARGTLRAVVNMGQSGGGSTISQQLAKKLFHGEGSRNIVERIGQKIKEWIIAIRLERQYTKEEIIAQYFNIYDFLNNADGIKSAASIYFNKQPNELDLKESAMLVGMFKNSALYNPRTNVEGVTNRRNVVLLQMSKYGYITERIKDSLQQTDLGLNYTPESHREGIATYFREYLKKFMKEWIDNNPKADGTKYNLYSDGLKVYTTIDSRMQQYAEDAVQSHMINLQAEFDIQNTPERNPTTPFLGLNDEEIDGLMNRSMRQSERWRKMKRDSKKSDEEIIESFNVAIPMTVFSWKGEIDTIMKPIDSMRYYKKFLHPGMMSMDPITGHVKAWVGGMNYRHFQYDHVKQGKRQVGSTFKPFVYATAIDQLHLSPCDEFPDVPYCIEEGRWGNIKDWCPENSGLTYGGSRTLKNALANSVNTITARLMDKVGPAHVIDMAHKLGVTTEIPEVPSIALGTVDLSVFEMVAAYATFANQGVYTEPVMVTNIEDKNNTILYQFTPKTKDVLSEEVAYVTVKLLEGVTEGGSGARLRTQGAEKWNAMYREIMTGYPYQLTNPIAGKTGTTQNQSDGWFMGMVPNLVTGVWVGAEDRAVHFKTITYGQGASMALPIWGSYMKSCYEDKDLDISTAAFQEPEELTIRVDCYDDSSSSANDDKTPNQDVPADLDF